MAHLTGSFLEVCLPMEYEKFPNFGLALHGGANGISFTDGSALFLPLLQNARNKNAVNQDDLVFSLIKNSGKFAPH